jgi:hypothetical protein
MLMYWFPVVLGIGAVIALAFLVWRWLWKQDSGYSGSAPLHPHDGAGFSVWSFRSGRWSLVEDKSAPGFAPGPPPAVPGQYEGHCLKVTSIRKPGVL